MYFIYVTGFNLFLFISVGRNGSGKSNFFYGKYPFHFVLIIFVYIELTIC